MVPSSFLVRSLFVYVSGLEIRSVFLVYFTFSLSCSMDSIVGSTSVVGSVSYAGRHVQSFWVIAELASFLCSLVFASFCYALQVFSGLPLGFVLSVASLSFRNSSLRLAVSAVRQYTSPSVSSFYCSAVLKWLWLEPLLLGFSL